jgi:hypothetical protein
MTLTNKSPLDGLVRRRTYVTCLKCGEELAYNWQKMKVEWPVSPTPLRPQTLVSIARGRRSRYQRFFAAHKPNLTRIDAERRGWAVFQADRTFGASAQTVGRVGVIGNDRPVTRLLAK